MCVVSAVTDNWTGRQIETRPWLWPQPVAPSAEEFQKLKEEVERLRKLLLEAKKFDEATGQPDCEKQGNVDLVNRAADYTGTKIRDIW